MGSVQEGGSSNGTMLMAGAGLAGGSMLGLKDWVTPYKLSVLVLLSEMSSTNPPTDPPTPSPPISLHHRRSLNLLILPLQQGPDLTFQQFVSTVEECCPPIIPTIRHRLFSMADRELQDLDQFFSTLSRCFSDSEVFKTSVVGLFVRQMLLAYNKLTFSQVYKLYKALQQYCSSEQRPHNDLSTITNEDMELTANEDVSMNTTQKKKIPTFNQSDLLDCLYQSEPWTDEGCGPLSQKQAEYFLARQAYMLKNDENRALTPDQLQDKLNNILKFNPDFAEAHYVSYLNSVRVQDVFTSTHSLLHYFDRLVLSTTDSKSNGDDGFGHSLRYAVLNLATLHCHFNHHQQADLALQEAIRIAQEANDHVCLQHCLSWLYTLEQMKGSDSAVLTEDSVKMAAHFCLPYLACLGVQSLVQRGALLGFSAPQLLDAQRRTSVLLWKQSLSELIEIGLAQSASLWNMYGKSTMAVQQSQLLLNMNSLEPMNFGIQQNNTESFAVVLSHLAQLHAEQGLYAAASDIIKHLKHQFPPHTQHARIWMLCDLNIQFEKAMNDGKYHLAEPHVTAISALDSTEGLYRKAELLRALNRTSEASRLLQQLQQQCEENKNPELTIRVMLSSAELHWNSSCYSAALPLLLKALSLSRQHNLQRLESKTVLHLAYIQLMLGVPEQALVLVADVLECVLAHGALMEKAKALLLMARCQAALSAADPHNHQHLTAAAVCTLDEASVYLLQLNCKQRLRDVYYLQARLHHTLRNHAQRNRCALMFRLLNQDLLHAPATPPHML